MTYTIKEAAKIIGVPQSTLRYYDSMGLLPFVKRKESGYRMFSDNDIKMLKVIECLKKSGMSINEIKQFSKWVEKGDASLQERYQMFLERKKAVEEEIKELEKTLEFIDHKVWYYETAIEAGTESIHFHADNDESLPCEKTAHQSK